MPEIGLPDVGHGHSKILLVAAAVGGGVGLLLLLRSGGSKAAAPAASGAPTSGGMDPILSSLAVALSQINDGIKAGNDAVDKETSAASASMAQAIAAATQASTAQNNVLQQQLTTLTAQLNQPHHWWDTIAAAFPSRFATVIPDGYSSSMAEIVARNWLNLGGGAYQDPQTKFIYFTDTGHYIGNGFRDFWVGHGGYATYGDPVGEEFTGPGGINEQVFQRGIMSAGQGPGSSPIWTPVAGN